MTNSPIKPEVQQKIFELRTHPSETKQWAGEAELVKESKKSNRFLLLTECCLYIIKKTSTKYVISKKESIFDLLLCQVNDREVTVQFHSIQLTGSISPNFNAQNNNINNPNNIKLNTINKRVYVFDLQESTALMENIYRAFRNIMWNINTNIIHDLTDINDPQYLEIKRKSKPHEEYDRPQNILLHRYIAASISKDSPVEKEAASVATNFDSHPKKIITLSNFNLVTPSPFFFVLTMEADIRSVVLDNFSPTNLGSILSWVFSAASKFLTVTLKNYENAVFKNLQIRRSSYNKCNTLFFTHCSSDFIQYFLAGFRNVSYSISTLVLQDMKLSDTVTPLLLKALQTFIFTSKLESLSLVDLQSELPLFEFLVQLFKNRENSPITQLIVENCGIDVCNLLSQISSLCLSTISTNSSENLSSNELRLQTLSLRRNYGRYIFGRDDYIPLSILHLNVGDCEWSPESLTAFLHTLCRWKRPLPLALDIDHARVNSWSTVFSHLPLEGLRSVITELNMNNNVMDSSCFEQFLLFLATQSLLLTNSPSKLMYLNLSSCFVDKVSDCIAQLLRFFLMREIWGLSLCDIITPASADVMDNLLNQLSDIQGLVSLDIRGNFVQDSASQCLLRFVRDSQSIAELAFDRCGITDNDQLLYLYESLLLSPHIIAFQKPIDDIKPISHRNETKRISNLLKMKNRRSTIKERLSLYLTLFGDFTTRVVSPIIDIVEVSASEVEQEKQPAHPPTPKIPTAGPATPTVTFAVGKKVPRPLFSIDSTQAIGFNPERTCNKLMLYENIFKSPVQNLFKKFADKSNETREDPLASIVAENIITCGTYGMVPPTTPPMKPPQNKFELPSIFATMQPLNDNEQTFNINESSMEFINIQSKLSALLMEQKVSFIKDQSFDQPDSIFSSAVTRINPKAVMTIPTAEINFQNEKK